MSEPSDQTGPGKVVQPLVTAWFNTRLLRPRPPINIAAINRECGLLAHGYDMQSMRLKQERRYVAYIMHRTRQEWSNADWLQRFGLLAAVFAFCGLINSIITQCF